MVATTATLLAREDMYLRVGRYNVKRDFTPEVLAYLKRWLRDRLNGDYDSPLPDIMDQDKAHIIRATGLKLVQVTGWFYNRRKDHRFKTLERFLNS